MIDIEAAFITSGNIQYGKKVEYTSLMGGEMTETTFYKQTRANNKGQWVWTGVSAEEFELARREFQASEVVANFLKKMDQHAEEIFQPDSSRYKIGPFGSTPCSSSEVK